MEPLSEITIETITPFLKDYLLLALRTGRYIKKYVDSYYGPPELQQLVHSEPQHPPTALLHACRTLSSEIHNQGFTPEREVFFEKMAISMECQLEILSGISIPFLERVQRCLDINQEYITDKHLAQAVDKLNEFYEGDESLYDKVYTIRTRRLIPKEDVLDRYKLCIDIVREKTYELFTDVIPSSERTDVKRNDSLSSAAYCRYQGNYNSVLEISLEEGIMTSWHNIMNTAAHESYPGHHTEFTIKEKELFRAQDYMEQCILLLNTPQMVISEGIANTAFDVLYSVREQESLILDVLCPTPNEEDVEDLIQERLLWKEISHYSTNLAYHAHHEEWDNDQLYSYMHDLGILPDKMIQRALKYLREPTGEISSFMYFGGETLIKNRFGDHPTPENFRKLLIHQVLPSDL
jgi:hypothetical protein